MTTDIATLRRIPLFAALSQEDLAQVAALVLERHYGRGDIIFLEGNPGGGLFLCAVRAGKDFQDLNCWQGTGSGGAIEVRQGRVVVLDRERLRLLASG